jgi:hypothetical protein
VTKPQRRKSMFSLSPVDFRNSPIAGRGVFARKRFAPGDLVVPYAPAQRRLDVDDPEAARAAESKISLLSGAWVIVPDTTVPGGWLCNHACAPNAVLFSSGEGRIECIRPIAPGEEVTIFYGWVTRDEPGRDPCLCGHATCRKWINFDVSTTDAARLAEQTPEGDAVRRRYEDYAAFLRSIDQEHVLGTIARMLESMGAVIPSQPAP